VAQREGRLHRNFQGYSTQAECDLLAFGVSSIGKVDNAYVQNVKTTDEYYAALDQGHLPVMRGLILSADDLLRRELISELMCQFSLDTKAFAQKYQIDFLTYFEDEYRELQDLQRSGLVELSEHGIHVPLRGRLLARRVAMVFDRHLRLAKTSSAYSKVL
jgi:oxygen-independent coproporphyrinogen-3 oxidase